VQFTKRLREGVRRGEITCSVRIWQRPHVNPGHRYRMGEGEIEVDSIQQIDLDDITPQLARESGFASVVDLLKVAKHGPGTNVYLVRFHYEPPGARAAAAKGGARAVEKPRGVNAARSDRERKRVARILEHLPEAVAVARGTHLSLEVRKKRFGYFLEDHHGDGRLAIHCKASPDGHDALRELAPEQVHVPAYLGSRGWIGLWLDLAKVEGSAVELALRDAYLLTAPKTLARSVQLSKH
jgi:hypothetical protein